MPGMQELLNNPITFCIITISLSTLIAVLICKKSIEGPVTDKLESSRNYQKRKLDKMKGENKKHIQHEQLSGRERT